MTEKEMIEEMAKCYCDYCMAQTGERECENQADKSCSVFWDCEFYYNAGYRKIPKEAVIQVPEKIYFQDKEFDMQVMYMARSTYDAILAQARKETAREILDQIKFLVEERNGSDIEDLSIDGTILEEVLDEIAKQFGVEVEG